MAFMAGDVALLGIHSAGRYLASIAGRQRQAETAGMDNRGGKRKTVLLTTLAMIRRRINVYCDEGIPLVKKERSGN